MPEVAALELQIGANVDKALAGIKQFDKSLFQMQEELKTFKAAQETTFDPKQFVEYGKKINTLGLQIANRMELISQVNNKTAIAVKETNTAMARMTKTSSSATNSMFALSGVIQDAPYGFRAIANNITFLAQEMAYTSKTAGGFKAAIKGMAGAFIGPAGIIFAISAATSLLTFFLNRSKKTGDEVEDLKIKVGELSDALLEGSKNAQKSVVNLDLLYKAAIDVSKSMGERLAAVKELQTKYPNYLGNLSQEQILAGKAADAYYRLRTQIIATARAKAAQETIVANEKQQLAIEAKLQDLAAKRNTLEAKQAQLADNAQAASGLNALSQTGNIAAGSVVNLGSKINDLNDEIKATVDQYNQLTAANNKLSASVNVTDLTTKIGGGGGGTGGAGKATAETRNAAQRAFVLNKQLNQVRDTYRSFTQAASTNIAGAVTTQFSQIGAAIQSVEPLLTESERKLIQWKATFQDGMKEINASLNEGITNAIAGAVEGLVNNGLGGAGQAILSVLGDIAVQMGKIAIGIGVTMLAIQASIASFNPFLVIAAGAALVALGTVAKSTVKGIALAQGGIAYGPTQALVGEYAGANSNPEVIAPLDKLKTLIGGMGEKEPRTIKGEFRIHGRDLRAVLNRTDDANSRVN